MTAQFFQKGSDLRKWFYENHKKETELLVGFYKVNSGKNSITWSESVDEALCFGWIDGIRRSIDDESYCIRFTPRKKASTWSAVNIKKIAALAKAGLMQPAGIEAFEKRKEDKSRIYSYEKEAGQLSEKEEKKFKTEKKAWKYFQSQTPSYIKTVIHWVISAKQESTRIKRLETLISDCAEEKKLKQYSYSKRK